MKNAFAKHQWKSARLKKRADSYSLWSVMALLVSVVCLFALPAAGMDKIWSYSVSLGLLVVSAWLRKKHQEIQVRDSRLK